MILNRIRKGMGNRPKPPDSHFIIQSLTDSNYSTSVYSFAQQQTRLLKSNVCYLLECNEMPTATFFKLLNNAGCKISRDSWVKSQRDVLYNSFVIYTMAYILKVDYNTLFAEDITAVYPPKP